MNSQSFPCSLKRLTIVAALLLFAAGAEGSGGPIADRLSDAQKQEIREKLDQSAISIDAAVKRAQDSADPLLAEFAALSKRYLGMIRAMTLGEDLHGQPVTPPSDGQIIALIDDTQTRIALFTERFAANPQLKAIMPQVEMISRQLASTRVQLLSRMALENSGALERIDLEALFARARAQLDQAETAIQGSPDEAVLRQRITDARERLERARSAGDLPAAETPLQE